MIAALILCVAQFASQSPLPLRQGGDAALPADPRIRTVPYQTEQVVPLRVANGYAAVIEFAPDERIENVVLGETSGWQVVPNRAGDRLVVKPTGGAVTNMVVLTDIRRYVFTLEPAFDAAGGAFALRFSYQPPPASLQARRVAADYRLRGDSALFPLAMNDDGTRTSVTWDPSAPLPAIFAVDDRGDETLVNARMVEGDYLIEGIARRYVLRRGRNHATATRRPLGPSR